MRKRAKPSPPPAPTPAPPAVAPDPPEPKKRTKYDELVEVLADGLFSVMVNDDDIGVETTTGDQGRSAQEPPDPPRRESDLEPEAFEAWFGARKPDSARACGRDRPRLRGRA